MSYLCILGWEKRRTALKYKNLKSKNMLHNRLYTALTSLAVLMMTACNADVPTASDERSGTSGTSFQEAVTFGVSEVQAVSRTGFVGELDELFMRATGFGVYAYITTDNRTWASAGATATPDFMTNQHVTYEGSEGWVYRPLKYWPNEAVDGTDPVDGMGGGTATTTAGGTDRVSFFAYAPYVNTDAVPYNDAAAALAAAAIPSFAHDGILSLPDDGTQGTPKIAYCVAKKPAFSVDLMYGVAARRYFADENTGGQGEAVDAGMPFTDMTKQLADGRLEYRFCHALTRLTVFADIIDNEDFPTDFNNTRVVISNITIAGGQLLYKRGMLSLENTTANTPQWQDIAGAVGDMSDYIATAVKHTDEGKFSSTYFAHQPLGVTTTEQSLFGFGVDGHTAAALLFIAGEASAAEPREWPLLTVTYHVIRRDGSEPFGYTDTEVTSEVSLENVVFKPSETTVLRLHFDFNEKNPTLIVDATKFTEQW